MVPFLTAKLDQEPPSRTAEERAILEILRDQQLATGRPWPAVPADDPFTTAEVYTGSDSEEAELEGAGFNVGVLTLGYATEIVQVRLTPPATMQDLLEQVSLQRDPVMSRVFPLLRAVEPQPSDAFGLLISLPGWPGSECVACYDLTECDGRLFTDSAPSSATKATLKRLAAVPENARVDVYVGTSAVPLGEDEEAAIIAGVCIFFVPQYTLPGPYFWLPDMLRSAEAWDTTCAPPTAIQGPFLCAVSERGHRCVAFASDADYRDGAVLANALDLQPDDLLLQTTQPPVQDDILSTFTPGGWNLHLERVTRHGSTFVHTPGQVAYASFVPDQPAASSDEAPESEPGTDDTEVVGHDPEEESQDSDSEGLRQRQRSRTPRRQVEAITMEPDAGFTAAFLVLVPEYDPESVLVTGSYAICLALPAWCTDTFIIIDALRLNGSVYAIPARAQCNRDTLLAYAGFAPFSTIEVYVPDRPEPLSADQEIQVTTGDCISLVPISGDPFVVTSLSDRLLDRTGWEHGFTTPFLPGFWVHALTAEGQDRFRIDPERRRFLRQEVPRQLQLDGRPHRLQQVRLDPPDAFDYGSHAALLLIVDTGRSRAGSPGGVQLEAKFPARPSPRGVGIIAQKVVCLLLNLSNARHDLRRGAQAPPRKFLVSKAEVSQNLPTVSRRQHHKLRPTVNYSAKPRHCRLYLLQCPAISVSVLDPLTLDSVGGRYINSCELVCYTDGSFYPSTVAGYHHGFCQPEAALGVAGGDNNFQPDGAAQALADAAFFHQRLFVHCQLPALNLLLVALHAPHRSTVVLAGDVNCAVGSCTSDHIGDCGAEQEDDPGVWWHRILKAYVLPEIHVALSCPDHIATCVHVELQLAMPTRSKDIPKRKICASTLRDPANAHKVAAVIAATPAVPWQVSAHAHAAIVVSHLQTSLSRIQSTAAPRPHHVYITDDTWTLQRLTTRWRRSLHRLRAQRRLRVMAAHLIAWRTVVSRLPPDTGLDMATCPWMLRADLHELVHQYQLNRLCKQLRRACRDDRDKYVSQLAHQVAYSPTSEVYQALHRLLHHRRKKPYAPEPLPQVRNREGDICGEASAAKQCWRDHFSAMEGGRESPVDRLPHDLLAIVNAKDAWTPPDDVHQLPRPTDLQRMMAATRMGKAPGPDMLPGELLKSHAQQLGHTLFPLLLKLALRGVEGIGLKGGLAVKFWKGKGSQQDPASYRQILLLSSIAKSMHQALRPALRDLYVEAAPELQLGGKPGKSVVYGAHLVRSFLRWSRSTRTPCFVLYADISSAFYSVARQLVAKSAHQTASAEGLSIAGIDLPAEDLALLKAHASEASALHRAGCSPWLESLSARLTEGTWFILQQDDTPVVTSRGSRPGSSWADLLFAFVVQRVLQKRDALMHSAHPTCHVPAVPWDGSLSLSPCDASAGVLQVDDLVWADDLASLRQCTTATQLPAGLATTVGALGDALAEHGFRLSMGASKTAAMAQPAGTGTRKVKRALFSHRGRKGVIAALREHAAPLSLPLVPTYRHLGVQHAIGGGMKAELTYRNSQARGAFQEGRRKVFKAPGVPLERKIYILRSSVLPKLLFGAGSWPPLSAGEYALFAGSLWTFYRQVLCIPRGGDQHYSAATVLALTQLPGPAVTLHAQRLQYLGQLTRTGPPALWAMLRQDRPYVAALQSSTRWLYRWVHATSDLPDPDGYWDQWVLCCQEKAAKFKGLCLRAQALEGPPPRIKQRAGTKLAYHADGSLAAQWRGPVMPNGLRRHLVYSSACLGRWGAFQAHGPCPPGQHPQAPPVRVSGSATGAPLLDFEPGISMTLLQALEEATCDEEELWARVVEHIVATIRATVQRWAERHDGDAKAAEAAENLQLLLDPDLIGEDKRVTPPRTSCPADVEPHWPELPSFTLMVEGELPFLAVEPPPKWILPPDNPRSMPLRQATAYATWLEQTCLCLARCLEGGPRASGRICCRGLEEGLGPAATWLRAIGCIFSTEGCRILGGRLWTELLEGKYKFLASDTAAEQMFETELTEDGPGGNVAWYLTRALDRGLSCVVSPLPRFELNAVDTTEGTALHFACSRELGNAALALLACGDFDLSVPKVRERDGSTALHLAAASGLEAVVQALVNRADFADFMGTVDKDGFTAIHGAAFRGHLGCMQALLRSPLVSEDIIAASGSFDVPRPNGHWAREAAELYDMNTALHMAAATGRVEICQLLLIHGPSAANKVNRMGATALHMAAKGGFVTTVETLLGSTCFSAVNARDARGFTALHWAAQQVNTAKAGTSYCKSHSRISVSAVNRNVQVATIW
ncbi:ANK3 [Symbiodinium sp. CCMP2592]|nr:ANK3 [Symbiodinium sp. CCMP2592]